MPLCINNTVRDAIYSTKINFPNYWQELIKKKISNRIPVEKMEASFLAGDWFIDSRYASRHVYYSKLKFGTIALHVGYKDGKEYVQDIGGKK